jgi:hypothetical protein
VANVRGEARELRTSLEGAQAQQRQAEERARGLEQRAKDADDLKAALDAKAAALVAAEERLLQEGTAREGAEGRLQQEQAALVDARTALEQERVAREAAQKSLAERDDKLSKAEGEVIMLSITNANQELSLREQGETIERLELTVEAVRRDFEMERKQVEGEPLFDYCLVGFLFGNSHSLFLISFLPWRFQACAPPWGTQLSEPRRCRLPTTPPSRSCRSCVARPSIPAAPWRRAKRRPAAR